MQLVKFERWKDNDHGGGHHEGAHGHHDNTEPDIEGADFGTGDLEFFLRAERSSHHKERAYKVTYRATDAAGNRTTEHREVVVRHDNRQH